MTVEQQWQPYTGQTHGRVVEYRRVGDAVVQYRVPSARAGLTAEVIAHSSSPAQFVQAGIDEAVKMVQDAERILDDHDASVERERVEREALWRADVVRYLTRQGVPVDEAHGTLDGLFGLLDDARKRRGSSGDASLYPVANARVAASASLRRWGFAVDLNERTPSDATLDWLRDHPQPTAGTTGRPAGLCSFIGHDWAIADDGRSAHCRRPGCKTRVTQDQLAQLAGVGKYAFDRDAGK